jgi:hypothetical protein
MLGLSGMLDIRVERVGANESVATRGTSLTNSDNPRSRQVRVNSEENKLDHRPEPERAKNDRQLACAINR